MRSSLPLLLAIAALFSACGGTESTNAACQDGVDNDGDGAVDCLDPDCRSLEALAERLEDSEDPYGHEDPDDDPLADSEPLLAACAQASIGGVVAVGEQRGLAVARLRMPELTRFDDSRCRPPLCAEAGGFNVHAAVRVPAGARERLEHLCRYVLRPPIATKRLSTLPDGRLLYALRKPWRDGTTSLLFQPLDFLARLAALVPAPRKNLITYHGVLAPSARLRPLVIPNRPKRDGDDEAASPQAAPRPAALTEVPTLPPGFTDRTADSPDVTHEMPPPPARRRIPWAELLKRTFRLDVLECECGGRRKLIAFVNRRDVAEGILRALDLPHQAPPIAPARDPPQPELALQ